MHKPTYFALKGRSSVLPTRRTCVRNVVAHTKLKVRQPGQGGAADKHLLGGSLSSGDAGSVGDESGQQQQQRRHQLMREQLAAREQAEHDKLEKTNIDRDSIYSRNMERIATGTSSSKPVAGLLTDTIPAYDDRDAIEDDDEEDGDEDAEGAVKGAKGRKTAEDSDSGFDSSEDEEDGDGDDSDDEEALMAELAKIRAERASAQQRREAEETHLEEIARREAAVNSNPLLDPETLGSGRGSGKLKRKWNEDVVFKNQTRDEPAVQKRFINDTVRSDFHRSFMKKYIK